VNGVRLVRLLGVQGTPQHLVEPRARLAADHVDNGLPAETRRELSGDATNVAIDEGELHVPIAEELADEAPAELTPAGEP
jgi:hypothetical protein